MRPHVACSFQLNSYAKQGDKNSILYGFLCVRAFMPTRICFHAVLRTFRGVGTLNMYPIWQSICQKQKYSKKWRWSQSFFFVIDMTTPFQYIWRTQWRKRASTDHAAGYKVLRETYFLVCRKQVCSPLKNVEQCPTLFLFVFNPFHEVQCWKRKTLSSDRKTLERTSWKFEGHSKFERHWMF